MERLFPVTRTYRKRSLIWHRLRRNWMSLLPSVTSSSDSSLRIPRTRNILLCLVCLSVCVSVLFLSTVCIWICIIGQCFFFNIIARWVIWCARIYGRLLTLLTSWWWSSEPLQRPRCKCQSPVRYVEDNRPMDACSRLSSGPNTVFQLMWFTYQPQLLNCILSVSINYSFVVFWQGYQVSLKSTQGPIDVFLCPEDISGVCSPVTGISPSKATYQIMPQPAEQPQCSSTQEMTLSTAASQQNSSPLPLFREAGKLLSLVSHCHPDRLFIALSCALMDLLKEIPDILEPIW